MNRIQLHKAFLIRSYPFSDDHLFYSFLSEQGGKFSALGYGAKKSKKRGLNSIDYFRLLEIEIFRKNKEETNLPYINNANLIKSFDYLSRDLSKISLYSYLLELIDNLLVEKMEGENYFLLLEYLLNSEELFSNLFCFTIGLAKCLKISGHSLLLDYCLECREKPPDGFLDYREGGLVCRDCLKTRKLPYIKEPLLQELKSIFFSPLNRIEDSGKKNNYLMLSVHLLSFIKYHFNFKFKSGVLLRCCEDFCQLGELLC